ncbi:MAG: aspartyl/asparaginyl beta-hydroxylase domain-containing protein [Micropepsaceae bacterium]
MALTGIDNALGRLVEAARRASRAGHNEEAARSWDQVQKSAPDHPEALYYFGQHALAQGDAKGAVQLLERAARAAPNDALIPLGLANAYRALGNSHLEQAALDAALRADPYCYPALLAKGALLERLGFHRRAARSFVDALKITPAEERLSADLRALVRRARAAVNDNTAALDAFVENRLGKLRRAHAGAPLSRFDECKDAMTGAKRIFTQQPVMLHFPQLPAIQFYDEAQFPWLKDLEAGTDAVERELDALLGEPEPGFRPYLNHPDGVPLNETASLNKSLDWSAYFFWDDGKRVDAHCRQCPQTSALIDAMPLAQVPGYTPAAFFSNLRPGVRIPPHTGVTNTRLIVHLGVRVPEHCSFRVGNETRDWRRGRAWIFDDTIEHEAKNDSGEARVILIFDIWNPYLSAAERDLVSELLAAQRDYYAEQSGPRGP